MGLIKEAIGYYKQRKLEEKARKTLLNRKPDFQLLEDFIRKVNENPGLKVIVYLHDGSRYELSTYQTQAKRDYEQINGEYVVK